MVADRTLLGLTLTATFAAGGMSGWALREQKGDVAYRPGQATSVYAQDLSRLRTKGYDESEMQEATKIHQEYMNTYRRWWDEFVRAHRDNLSAVDRTFEEKKDGLEVRFRARTGLAAERGPDTK